PENPSISLIVIPAIYAGMASWFEESYIQLYLGHHSGSIRPHFTKEAPGKPSGLHCMRGSAPMGRVSRTSYANSNRSRSKRAGKWWRGLLIGGSAGRKGERVGPHSISSARGLCAGSSTWLPRGRWIA